MIWWLLILAYLAIYLWVALRLAPRFAKDYRAAELQQYPSLYQHYDGRPDRAMLDHLNREAVWTGFLQAVFWPLVLIHKRFTDYMVDALTADERKAKELAEARRIIAEYEAEQLRRPVR